MRYLRVVRSSVLILALLLLSTSQAFAAGFSILEQSAEGVGKAFAGSTTGYGDGSSVFFNPAAMTVLDETTATAGVHLISTHADFTNAGSTVSPLLGGTPLAGDNGPDGGTLGVVPNLYIVHPLSDKWTFGLGVNAPFGLATEYSREWVGRYAAVDSSLATINVNPAVAYKFSDKLSVGLNLQVMRAEATLSNMVDFGTIGVSSLGLPTAAAMGLLPQSADGFAEVEGDDWGIGFGAGILYKYAEGSRVAIAFRSKVDITLEGDATFEVPTAALPLTATGAFTNTPATAGLTLPESVSFGVVHKVCDHFSLLAEAQWTAWSRFEELRVIFDSVQPDSVVDESWKDVWRFSVAGEYQATEDLTLSLGYTLDKEPIPDEFHRTPRIPGNDRHWIALGGSYQIRDNLRASLSYAHLFVENGSTAITGSTGEVLMGDWDASVDILSAQVAWMLG